MQTPLGALSIIGCIRVVLKVGIELVQTVIGQMDVLLLSQVSVSALIVLLCGESSESILVDVETKRVD